MLLDLLQSHYKAILGALLVVGVVILTGSLSQASQIIPGRQSAPSSSFTPKSQPSSLAIDIAGAVNHPGVYTFSVGSRVEQAIKAAGGLTDQADTDYLARNLNLSQKLADGMKIYIPSLQQAGVEVALVSTSSDLININTASAADLDHLSGITPAMAQKIIDKRPYQTLDQLVSKKVITKTVLDKIKKQITLM